MIPRLQESIFLSNFVLLINISGAIYGGVPAVSGPAINCSSYLRERPKSAILTSVMLPLLSMLSKMFSSLRSWWMNPSVWQCFTPETIFEKIVAIWLSFRTFTWLKKSSNEQSISSITMYALGSELFGSITSKHSTTFVCFNLCSNLPSSRALFILWSAWSNYFLTATNLPVFLHRAFDMVA